MLFQNIAPSSKPISPCSVFDLAQCPIRLKQDFAPSTGRPPHRLERMGDITRCIVVQEQDTAEWQEREKARRARQTPPRPGAKVLASMNAMKGPPRVLTASRVMA